jgi:hypothetical protein
VKIITAIRRWWQSRRRPSTSTVPRYGGVLRELTPREAAEWGPPPSAHLAEEPRGLEAIESWIEDRRCRRGF